jgi:hypothetical protein
MVGDKRGKMAAIDTIAIRQSPGTVTIPGRFSDDLHQKP